MAEISLVFVLPLSKGLRKLLAKYLEDNLVACHEIDDPNEAGQTLQMSDGGIIFLSDVKKTKQLFSHHEKIFNDQRFRAILITQKSINGLDRVELNKLNIQEILQEPLSERVLNSKVDFTLKKIQQIIKKNEEKQSNKLGQNNQDGLSQIKQKKSKGTNAWDEGPDLPKLNNQKFLEKSHDSIDKNDLNQTSLSLKKKNLFLESSNEFAKDLVAKNPNVNFQALAHHEKKQKKKNLFQENNNDQFNNLKGSIKKTEDSQLAGTEDNKKSLNLFSQEDNLGHQLNKNNNVNNPIMDVEEKKKSSGLDLFSDVKNDNMLKGKSKTAEVLENKEDSAKKALFQFDQNNPLKNEKSELAPAEIDDPIKKKNSLNLFNESNVAKKEDSSKLENKNIDELEKKKSNGIDLFSSNNLTENETGKKSLKDNNDTLEKSAKNSGLEFADQNPKIKEGLETAPIDQDDPAKKKNVINLFNDPNPSTNKTQNNEGTDKNSEAKSPTSTNPIGPSISDVQKKKNFQFTDQEPPQNNTTSGKSEIQNNDAHKKGIEINGSELKPTSQSNISENINPNQASSKKGIELPELSPKKTSSETQPEMINNNLISKSQYKEEKIETKMVTIKKPEVKQVEEIKSHAPLNEKPEFQKGETSDHDYEETPFLHLVNDNAPNAKKFSDANSTEVPLNLSKPVIKADLSGVDFGVILLHKFSTPKQSVEDQFYAFQYIAKKLYERYQALVTFYVDHKSDGMKALYSSHEEKKSYTISLGLKSLTYDYAPKLMPKWKEFRYPTLNDESLKNPLFELIYPYRDGSKFLGLAVVHAKGQSISDHKELGNVELMLEYMRGLLCRYHNISSKNSSGNLPGKKTETEDFLKTNSKISLKDLFNWVPRIKKFFNKKDSEADKDKTNDKTNDKTKDKTKKKDRAA